MAIIHTYLRFNGNAKEAFNFYKDCLGGELSIQTVGQSPMAKYMQDKNDLVFHAQLKKGDLVVLGSDLVPDEGYKKGNSVVVTLECESKDEARELFDKLSKDGTVGHVLEDQEWGTIGDFTDKYNIDWFVVFTPNN